MKKIRLGNDIHVSWEILRNGEPEDFTDKVVEVKLVHAQTFTSVPIEWSIEGNVIEFNFFGKDQKRKGEYRIILTENRGELGMSTLDACEAFYLVDHSCKESDGTKCPTLKVQHVRLTGSFSLSGSVVKPDVSGQIEEHNQDQEAHPFIQNKIAKVVSEALADYIKKETGKGLSTNDFTNELKARLENLTPYDPSKLEAEIGKLKTTINTLVSGNASNAIESFNEIIAFLNSVSDTETLEGIIAGIINTVSKIEEKIPTKVSELEDDLSIVTLNDSTPLVESLVGNELIPIKQDGENKAVSIEQIKNNVLALSSKYEFVDLGLPSGTKWATTNIGAVNPEDAGLYFAWGETQGYTAEDVAAGKKAFSWNDYKFGTQNNLTKYNATDGLTQLELIDDAAYQNDNACRMPTKDEYQELFNTTISNWETLNGINGIRFTSKTNGNSIFVPAAGFCNDGLVSIVGSYGALWSSSLDESNPEYGWYLGFHSNNVDVGYSDYRYNGSTVRAVQVPNTPPTTINLKELKDKIEEAKEVFIITSDMIEETEVSTLVVNPSSSYKFTDDGYNQLCKAVQNNKIIVIDEGILNLIIPNAVPYGLNIIHKEKIIITDVYSQQQDDIINRISLMFRAYDKDYNYITDYELHIYEDLIRFRYRSLPTLETAGEGNKFLTDDGTYKTIDIASILSRLDALEGK